MPDRTPRTCVAWQIVPSSMGDIWTSAAGTTYHRCEDDAVGDGPLCAYHSQFERVWVPAASEEPLAPLPHDPRLWTPEMEIKGTLSVKLCQVLVQELLRVATQKKEG